MKNIYKEFLYSYFYAKKKNVFGRIYFYNIWGKYNDNTKILAETFHELCPDYELIYEIKDDVDPSIIPQYIHTVQKGTKESFYYKSTAMVIIDNDWGAIKKSCVGFKGKMEKMILKKIISKNTLYVSTGHGTPIKRIGCDALNNKYDDFITSTNIMYVLDKHSAQVYKNITLNSINEIITIGSPRNDVLFYKDKDKEKLKEKLGLANKKIILFAPTFRTISVNGVTKFIGVDEYIKELIELAPIVINALNKKFGGSWIIGIRNHPGIDSNSYIKESNYIFNANILDDMAQYLSITDILITDYSSCAIDYILTGRPCFLLWNDSKEYINNEIGLYFYDELPFEIAYSFNEIIEKIESFSEPEYKEKISVFSKLIDMSYNQNVSKNIVNDINSRLIGEKNEKNKTRIL